MPKFAIAAAVFLASIGLLLGPARAEEALPHEQWSFDGVFGTYNRAALQRGYQVYHQICSACHALNHLHYRDLEQIGYTPAQVKAIAAQHEVLAGPDKQGKMFKRPAQPADPFVKPFPNVEAARAAFNGAAPPDLSLIVSARDGGADYVYAILTGFEKAPKGVTVPAGRYYDEYFPAHFIAMPPPLQPGAVHYADGTKASVPQMAHDVATFLTWAAHPNLEARHRIGFKVMLFLIVGCGVFYAAKRKIWSRLH